MKHLGNISNINGADIEPVDCITFGSPCQDLSVAGKRKGLEGERSGLFMEAVRVIKEMRKADEVRQLQSGGAIIDLRCVRPRFAVWENVPGAFSSNNGDDFRVVLEELCRIREKDIVIPECPKRWQNAGYIEGYDWSIAWRVMDAQYWGVPQRRKRIALVMDFADRCAGKILFEQYSLSGHSVPSIPPWKGIARNPEECAGECDSEDSYTLKLRHTGSDTRGGVSEL